MQLTVIDGGRESVAAPPVPVPDTDVERWLELADAPLRLAISTRLAGLSTASRERLLADLAPVAAADLRGEPDVLAAISPSAPAPLAIAACRMVRNLRSPAAAGPRLERALTDSSCARVRLSAAEALVHVGGQDARRALAEALVRDDDEDVRARAARCLGRMQDHRAVPMLGAALANVSEAPAVRGEAAEALGVIGRRSVTPLLVRALRDHAPDVRGGAALALGMLGGLEVILALRPLERDHAVAGELGPVSGCAAGAIADIQRRASLAG